MAENQTKFLSYVLVHNIANMHNVGTLARSATAFGVSEPIRTRLECVGSVAASFASGGGWTGSGGRGDGGGGGGGASEGGEVKAVPGGAEDASSSSSDVIILDVTNETVGAKRHIFAACRQSPYGLRADDYMASLAKPQVSSASVNLTTEITVVWPVDEAKVVPDWQKLVGDALANHLTNCGFKSNLQDYSNQVCRKPGAQKRECLNHSLMSES